MKLVAGRRTPGSVVPYVRYLGRYLVIEKLRFLTVYGLARSLKGLGPGTECIWPTTSFVSPDTTPPRQSRYVPQDKLRRPCPRLVDQNRRAQCSMCRHCPEWGGRTMNLRACIVHGRSHGRVSAYVGGPIIARADAPK